MQLNDVTKVSKPLKEGIPKRFLVLIVLLMACSMAWLYRWSIFDWWRLQSYEASPEITRLVQSVQMSHPARRIFYAYHPELADKQKFNNYCSNTEQTIILGCYIGGRGIYLYNVTDERLEGVKEVTAAHELLHAVYDRLTLGEKKRIDQLLLATLDDLDNDRIRATVENYRKRDPDVVVNELHSIIGTEVRDIPPELEEYYAKYFLDRQSLVTFSEQYEAVFTKRKQKVAELDKRLTELKAEIDALQAVLEDQRRSISQEKQRLDELLEDQDYEEYNKGVDDFNSNVRNYNNNARRLQGNIDEFNRLVQERNSIALEENELLKAIDSRPETIPTP